MECGSRAILLANAVEAKMGVRSSSAGERSRKAARDRSLAVSLKAQPVPAIPGETARVARAALPKGQVWLRLRAELGGLSEDEGFTALFSSRGRPAGAPLGLALVSVRQYAEGLWDRQAAEAVRSRLDGR